MSAIEIGDMVVSSDRIVSAKIETQHYVNCTVSSLVVKLADGYEIRREQGYGFDPWKVLDKIKAAMG